MERESCYNNKKASYSQSTRPPRGDRGKKPSGSRCRHALDISTQKNTKELRNNASTPTPKHANANE
eukprot:1794975-Pleurochrysis_carterae.AAC.2